MDMVGSERCLCIHASRKAGLTIMNEGDSVFVVTTLTSLNRGSYSPQFTSSK